MRKEEKQEKKPVSWEVIDPKPPVIQSGHMENRIFNGDNTTHAPH